MACEIAAFNSFFHIEQVVLSSIYFLSTWERSGGRNGNNTSSFSSSNGSLLSRFIFIVVILIKDCCVEARQSHLPPLLSVFPWNIETRKVGEIERRERLAARGAMMDDERRQRRLCFAHIINSAVPHRRSAAADCRQPEKLACRMWCEFESVHWIFGIPA